VDERFARGPLEDRQRHRRYVAFVIEDDKSRGAHARRVSDRGGDAARVGVGDRLSVVFWDAEDEVVP